MISRRRLLMAGVGAVTLGGSAVVLPPIPRAILRDRGPEPPPPPSAPDEVLREPEVRFPSMARPYTLDPYRGLGAWIDVFDWAQSYAGEGRPPSLGLDVVDQLANVGVRTIFLQTGRPDYHDDVVEPARLFGFVERAHSRGVAVVGWFLPPLLDVDGEVRRTVAMCSRLELDGVGIDIESRVEPDVALRNRRLQSYSEQLRAAARPGTVLGAIVVPPTTMEDVNPLFWTGFDWAMLGRNYDVFLPMNYWTGRLADSPWRNAGWSTAENVARLRARTGRPDLPVHMIGGIANGVTPAEVTDMVAAVESTGAIGASLYDVATTVDWQLWPPLMAMRVP